MSPRLEGSQQLRRWRQLVMIVAVWNFLPKPLNWKVIIGQSLCFLICKWLYVIVQAHNSLSAVLRCRRSGSLSVVPDLHLSGPVRRLCYVPILEWKVVRYAAEILLGLSRGCCPNPEVLNPQTHLTPGVWDQGSGPCSTNSIVSWQDSEWATLGIKGETLCEANSRCSVNVSCYQPSVLESHS